MVFIFFNAVLFNKKINNWNVTNIKCMFVNANFFNQNISNWNKVNINYMFCFNSLISFYKYEIIKKKYLIYYLIVSGEKLYYVFNKLWL